MLINRSLPVAILPLVVILMQFTFISPLPPPFPAHRRTLGFVGKNQISINCLFLYRRMHFLKATIISSDHFIRVNPLRALSNYLGRKLSLSVYYPPPPPPRQQFQPQPQLQQIVYVPGGMPPPQSTHYVKLPVYLGQNVAMIPPVNPASQYNIVSQPNYQQVQQPPQPQQYFLHGISYPVSVPPPSQYFMPQLPQQTFVQPAVSSYQPPVVTQATSVQQVQPQQPQQAPITYVPQTNILVDEHHKIQHDGVQYPYSLGSNIHTESSPSQAVDNSFGTLPTLVNSAFEINDNSPSLNPHASPNVQIDGFEDASSAGNMLKIFVIRPKDMERLKSSTESERNELAKEYSMKYFDLEQGAQELGLDSSGESSDQVNKNEADLNTQKDERCIEPLCDPFLQKLIPQLLQSARNGKEDDDPIVIVKNNSHITTFNEDPFLQNHRLVDLDVSQSEESNNDDEPQFTVMKAVEGVEGHTTEEIFEGQHSTLKPKRVKVHFPRRKFLSAKISSAALRRKQTQSGLPAEKSDETNSSEIFSMNASLIPKPRNLEIDEVTYPRYKYRTARSRNLDKERTARAGDFNERKDNSQGKTLIHYAGGVIFNDDSKVSK